MSSFRNPSSLIVLGLITLGLPQYTGQLPELSVQLPGNYVYCCIDFDLDDRVNLEVGTFLAMPACTRISYSRDDLLNLRHERAPPNEALTSDQCSVLKDLGLFRFRGKRAGKHQQRVSTSSRLSCENQTTDDQFIDISLWNARSVRNKADLIHDYLLECDVDALVLTETWLNSDDNVTIGELIPDGYGFIFYQCSEGWKHAWWGGSGFSTSPNSN